MLSSPSNHGQANHSWTLKARFPADIRA